ncbi:MAG TPA: tetratricopeptide repeat protein [Candidatus Angelobacter sp.]|nr:tetratricopeptide repeat protein [Candidatus Angelobacter sp.]
MNPRVFLRRFAVLVIVVLVQLHGKACVAQEPRQEVLAIVAQSQQALEQHDETKALTLIKEGLVRFPGQEDLKIQLARVYVEQKHDRRAIGLLNSILRANPSNRNAKLELAQIFGYRGNYRESDRLYRDLLAANADDEAASLGLVHNLILEGNRDAAQQQLQQALVRHPTSLELLEYSDYLTEKPAGETPVRTVHRLQNTESFFSDTSGNRSIYSSQGINYQFTRNISSRVRVEENSLWQTGTVTETLISGAAEGRYRLNRYMAVRSSVGAVRFVDENARVLYGGDLELFPRKDLFLSGGFARYPIAPTFDSLAFNLLAEGWHSRLDYTPRNLTVSVSLSITHYSDGNHAEREWAEGLRWFPWHDGQFAVGGGYAFRHIHFTKDLNHGYFSPNQYRSHLGAAGFRMRLGKHYRGEYLGYGGAELLEDFADYSPAGEMLLKNDFFFGHWDLGADYSYFHLIQTTGAFRANAATITLGYKF